MKTDGINKVILLGILGKDPVIHYIAKDSVYARFPLATNETYLNKHNEKISTTEWHNIVLWRKLAQTAEQKLKKGSQIYIEGKIRHRVWTNEDKQTNHITEIHADKMLIIKSTKKEEIREKPIPIFKTEESEDKDNLPF